MSAVPTDHGPGVRPPPPVLVAALVAAGWGLGRVVPLPLHPPLPGTSLGLLLAGAALVGWSLTVMLRAHTDPRPDNPDTTLVEAGPFGFGRNPIYLGFVLAALGAALLQGQAWNWLAAALAWLALDRLVVAREEAYLAGRFGPAYAAYRARVRRWL